ncbi:MAG: chromate transporter [Verrucomicrobiales bacterium]|jgi:chromate transporter
MKHLEILWRFLALGCASFGGPAAHVGYFRKAFVEKEKWLDDSTYARLLALCQFLPGPASSQLGFAIGCRRGGVLGGVLAFIGFTLPSFLLIVALATATSQGNMPPWFDGVVRGLKWLAVVVVADATLGMFRNFCQTRLPMALCVVTATALLTFPNLMVQFGALIVSALIGASFLKATKEATPITTQGKIRWGALITFGIIFAVSLGSFTGLFGGFFRAGSLVFGGGHVVLPLLQNGYSEAVSPDRFLLGYAAAQAVPGPMFCLAGFLGAELTPTGPWLGALVATIGVFLPGFLLVVALSDAWESLAQRPKLAGAVCGLNAAVVGLLLAAFYNPVFLSAVQTPTHFAITLLGFFALRGLKLPLLVIVAAIAVTGVFVA